MSIIFAAMWLLAVLGVAAVIFLGLGIIVTFILHVKGYIDLN